MSIDFNDIKSIKANGFQGFHSMQALRNNPSLIPLQKGVYFILRKEDHKPHFLAVGSGGHFKGKNPNVSIATLTENWVEYSQVIYIGKAGGENSGATLQSRLNQYLKFGQGKPVGHWGGRFIWQIADSDNLIICWKTLPDMEPRQVESNLIEQFVSLYGKHSFSVHLLTSAFDPKPT